MLTIYKYTLVVEDYFSLDLPRGAKILAVQEQHNQPQLWALVNPTNSTQRRNFRLAGTGHPIDKNEENLNYIGTFQLADGNFIGHLFEIIKR